MRSGVGISEVRLCCTSIKKYGDKIMNTDNIVRARSISTMKYFDPKVNFYPANKEVAKYKRIDNKYLVFDIKKKK